jgi:hypothetical protein
MRVVRIWCVAFAAFLFATAALATHIPGPSEPIVYDGPLKPGIPATGTIGFKSPVDGYDWYCFQVKTGTPVSISVLRTSGDIVPNLGILNGLAAPGGVANLPQVAATSNPSETSAKLDFTPEFDGTVTLWVSTFLGEDGGGYSVTMTGGTSDGACGAVVEAPLPSFQITIPSEYDINPLVLGNASTRTVKFDAFIDITFDSIVALSVVTDAKDYEDLHASITPSSFPKPGFGSGAVTVTTGPLTFPRVYQVVIVGTSEAGEIAQRTLLVELQCDPPFILGLDQPKSITAGNGTQVTLEVKPTGSAPFFYQWYKGVPGMIRNPVLAANESKLIFTTRETATYWVRVSNACGSVNSGAATVTTIGSLSGPARRRSGG